MEVTIAFIVLRIVLAWFFLYPVKGLIINWNTSVNMVKLVIPIFPNVFTVLMILTMIVGSLSVLLGIFAPVGALLLFVYSLIGVAVHYKLSQKIKKQALSESASQPDQSILAETKALGVAGHTTSAQKNIVVASALLIIILIGSGPLSLLPLF